VEWSWPGLTLDSLPLWMSQVDFGGLKQKLITSPSVAAARRHFGDPRLLFFCQKRRLVRVC
jgi:hypothetical protein